MYTANFFAHISNAACSQVRKTLPRLICHSDMEEEQLGLGVFYWFVDNRLYWLDMIWSFVVDSARARVAIEFNA